MITEKIHVVVNEPTTDYGVGGFEWRTNREDAEKAFRSLRGNESTTYLYNDVTVPVDLREDHDAITEWVDSIYWGYGADPEQMHNKFGAVPTRVYAR